MNDAVMKSVMLVENEDSLARAVDHVVTCDGHRCARLAPGDHIIDRVTQDRPDLLLMDLSHCDRSAAMTACQTIRRQKALSGTKILLMQASAGTVDRRRSLGMGADGVVNMPMRLDELRREMRRLLGTDELEV